MQYCGMHVEGLDASVIDYINEIKANYEQQIHKIKMSEIEYQNKYLELKERYDLLIYKRFGRSAEQLQADDSQQLLFVTETSEPPAAVAEAGAAEQTTEVQSYRRKKPGRKPLDPNLPRTEKIVDIPESEKTCACGAQLTKIGEETSERLQIIPPRIYVEKTIRPKYACRCCEGTEDEEKSSVLIAPVEPVMIPRSIANPSL